jgi:hypothetical protein
VVVAIALVSLSTVYILLALARGDKCETAHLVMICRINYHFGRSNHGTSVPRECARNRVRSRRHHCYEGLRLVNFLCRDSVQKEDSFRKSVHVTRCPTLSALQFPPLLVFDGRAKDVFQIKQNPYGVERKGPEIGRCRELGSKPGGHRVSLATSRCDPIMLGLAAWRCQFRTFAGHENP